MAGPEEAAEEKQMANRLSQSDEFEIKRAKLQPLIDTEPAKAISEARLLPLGYLSGLKAAILVDAGSRLNDMGAVSEGILIFQKLIQEHPERSEIHYNLGNGLVAIADMEPYKGSEWYLATGITRQEARAHFQKALSLKGAEKIASVTLTNLGNALWKAHRWVEAYNAYTEALKRDPTNGVAATGAAKILLKCVDRRIGDRKILLSVAARHLNAARKKPGRIKELAGAQAYEELSKLLEKPIKGGRMPDLTRADEYEKFVASYRLALSPTIEGLDLSLKRWDSLMIQSFTEPIGSSSGVPPIFAMFNVLKSDFLLARLLAYKALKEDIPDSGFYSDTLDYAIYGAKPSALTLAQRACMDVLDKIAVATTEYFAIPGPKREIYFPNRWFTKPEKGQPPKWHPILAENIKSGNTAIIALAELSLDISEGGFLHEKKTYRRSSTHRFTIIHDLGCEPSRLSPHIEHTGADRFESILLESLQLVRAAIMYFHEMIQLGERGKKARIGKTAPMTVHSHHWIRGEDDRK